MFGQTFVEGLAVNKRTNRFQWDWNSISSFNRLTAASGVDSLSAGGYNRYCIHQNHRWYFDSATFLWSISPLDLTQVLTMRDVILLSDAPPSFPWCLTHGLARPLISTNSSVMLCWAFILSVFKDGDVLLRWATCRENYLQTEWYPIQRNAERFVSLYQTTGSSIKLPVKIPFCKKWNQNKMKIK